jgi:phage-related minor tail protein
LAVYDTNVKLTKEIEATVVAAEMLGDTDMSQGFKNALTVAQQLALATRNILFPTVPERGDPRSFENDPYWQDRAFPKPYVPTAPSGGGGGGGGSAPSDPLADLMKRIELEKELLGTSEEYQEVMQAIQDSDKKYSDAAIQGAVARLEAINKEKEALQQMESLQQSIAETIGDGFMSMVDGTKTVKEAFRDMARDIIKQLYEVLVIQRLVNGVKTILGGSGLFADGGAFSAGRQIQAYANGGVVGGPTYFPMSGGKTGLMGEAGPEAIMPLKRGKGGKLGVSVEGSSGSVNVVNNINVTGGSDPAAIRAEVAKLMPQITSATKSAVIDARRRGGQMKAAFN